MASAYPGGLDTFATNKANATATTTDHPAHHNDLADAVNKIEAELGITPSGAAATVAARFTAVEAAPHLMLEGSLVDSAGADDVLWDGNDVAGFTEIAITGTNNLIETDGMLSAKWWNVTNEDVGGLLKARAFTIGDAWTVPVWLQCEMAAYGFAGILIANGTAGTSASLIAALRHESNNNTLRLDGRRGTLTNNATEAQTSVEVGNNRTWLKLTYVAANTFRVEGSPNGLHYSAMQADISFTLTPTHIGVGWMFGSATEATGAIATFGPLRKVA